MNITYPLMFNTSSVSAKAAADKIAAEMLLKQIRENVADEMTGNGPEGSTGQNTGPGCHATGSGNDHL